VLLTIDQPGKSGVALKLCCAGALNADYYPSVSAPLGCQSLFIPSTLGEVEMALCLEMFITANSASVLDQMDTVLGLCVTLIR